MAEAVLKQRLAAGEQLLMDGGMGSELERRGIPTTLPLWSAEALFTHPEVVQQIHEDYLRAGAEIIITNTFRTTTRAFAKKGIADQATSATALACTLAHQAIQNTHLNHEVKVYIAGSVAPLEDCYSPELTPPQEEIEAEYAELVAQLKQGGVDFILLETMITAREALSGVRAAQNNDLPFAVSFCANDRFELLGGESLQEVVPEIEKFQPLFIGVNCVSTNIATQTVKKLRTLTTIPISVYAQGYGLADDEPGWKMVGEQNKPTYVQAAQQWLADGAQIIGGCCGTTPAYIHALQQLLHSIV